MTEPQETIIATLKCGICKYRTPQRPLSILSGLYLVHMIKCHWETVLIVKKADADLITEMFRIYGKKHEE